VETKLSKSLKNCLLQHKYLYEKSVKLSNYNDKPKIAKRKNKCVWLGIIVVLTLIIIYSLRFLPNSKSADEQLAEIEAARAIPDSENAGIIYDELVEDYNYSAISPAFLDPNTADLTRHELWLSEDHPKLAEWIKEQHELIAKLLDAAKKDKCRFPIADYTDHGILGRLNRRTAMRGWVFFLARAANNDIAEGRTDDAIAKYRCVIQLARHFYQQPILIEHLVGLAVESLGLQGLYRLLIETDLTETQIKAIEQFQPNTRDNWADVSAETRQVERLLSQKMSHPLARLKAWWSDMFVKSPLPQMQDIYLRIVSDRRALKIIIELRRYKNKHSHWPKTLDEIKTLAPAEVFVDLVSGDSFVYKLADDTFILYSKGKNKIDEHGQQNAAIAPDTRELIVHKDDHLIWPPKTSKKKEENTDDK
jgi:hypothetical protein